GLGLVGLGLVWLNRYGLIEKLMTVLIGVMFLTVLFSAALTAPNVGDILAGLVPRIPSGDPDVMFYVLGLAGGVGGTITLGAYA
ncbi:divalent metal cation transporter, partial [Xanthomonas citri pv. citri]|nr:divalent metal cation transporter [Xanthomonas citri pv. citri]